MEQDPEGKGRGSKLVLTMEVWEEADRAARHRNVKAHLYLQDPTPRQRGMYHNRLRSLGLACARFTPERGTDVQACSGQWVSVFLAAKPGTNQHGNPTTFNYVDTFGAYADLAELRARYDERRGQAPAGAPAAPTAGTGAPQPPAPAAPPAYQPVQPTQPTGDYPRPEGTGIGYADTQPRHARGRTGWRREPTKPHTTWGRWRTTTPDIPFATAGYAETRSRRSVLASMPKAVW